MPQLGRLNWRRPRFLVLTKRVAMDRTGLFALAQLVLGISLASAGLGIGLYQYLVNREGEALRQNAGTKLFYRIIMVTLLLFGAYIAITAFFHAPSI